MLWCLLYEVLDVFGFDFICVYCSVYWCILLLLLILGGCLVYDNVLLFWIELVVVIGDVDIGLYLGEVMKLCLFDVVGYLLLFVCDLEEVLCSFVCF